MADVAVGTNGPLLGRFRAAATGECLQKVDDLLLSGGSRVELATHLRKPSVNLRELLINMVAEVGEVFSKSVEPRRRGPIGGVDADEVTLAYGQAYHVKGWTVDPSFDGTRFTNDASGHGMFVNIDGVSPF